MKVFSIKSQVFRRDCLHLQLYSLTRIILVQMPKAAQITSEVELSPSATDSYEKTLMLEMIEGRRKRGRQGMRWLDGITNSWTRV